MRNESEKASEWETENGGEKEGECSTKKTEDLVSGAN